MKTILIIVIVLIFAAGMYLSMRLMHQAGLKTGYKRGFDAGMDRAIELYREQYLQSRADYIRRIHEEENNNNRTAAADQQEEQPADSVQQDSEKTVHSSEPGI